MMKIAKEEQLIDWYAVDENASGLVGVALCQRTNVASSTRLLRSTSNLWIGLAVAWTAILLILSIALGLLLEEFLLGVFVPLLHPFLDTFNYWRGIKKASNERATLAEEIQDKIESNELNGENLMVWQSRMYEFLRVASPQVPDLFYSLKRNDNESIMHRVVAQLSSKAGGKK